MAIQCPLCRELLSIKGRTYACDNRHTFDIAKEGYVNLVPVQHKRSTDPGDNKEMMQARRRFLEGGHYGPMRDRVANRCLNYLRGRKQALLDVGCGEGYYTAYLADALKRQDKHSITYGLDVSKTAIRYAAGRYRNCRFIVASSHRLPFSDLSLDGVVCIYAPCKGEELCRCLKGGGVVITVTPAARHLYQLKQGIYDQIRLHEKPPEEMAGFEWVEEQALHYRMALSGNDAFDLLQMTPLAWRARNTFKEAIRAAERFECEADFLLRVYRKL